ncbi:MAG: PTS sugar transporter subunit IIA [Victivallaceae bacterium]|nr:PTS sugar transporter subunit IIA [Victivallaceae bacterium]
MKLEKYLTPESIFLNIEVAGKASLLDIMSKRIAVSKAAVEAGLDYKAILKAIQKREEQSPTGIGDGFAFPHARFSNLNSVGICLAVLKNSIDYESFDRKTINVACMVIVPEKKPTLALKIMSHIARIFSSGNFHEKIRNLKSGTEAVRLISSLQINLDISITAVDIMRRPILTLTPDMPLKIATRCMADARMTAVPVVENERVIGEISTTQLFLLGIPDFFTQLKSVSFISDFDPFEKYFYEEIHSTVADLMSNDFCVMAPEATVMELVFALIIRKYPKIYIVRNGMLEGIIDESLMLERIINI